MRNWLYDDGRVIVSRFDNEDDEFDSWKSIWKDGSIERFLSLISKGQNWKKLMSNVITLWFEGKFDMSNWFECYGLVVIDWEGLISNGDVDIESLWMHNQTLYTRHSTLDNI